MNKSFRETLKNIWKIEDLKAKLGVTILFILIYRFGSFIVLPGIDPNTLAGLHDQTKGGLLALLDMFSGGAFSNASIFALGIMPYISASIVVQLLGIAVPYFQKMQKEGESGRRKMNQITRYLTVLILLVQGPSYLVNLNYQMHQMGGVPLDFWFNFSSTIILCAGSMFVMWLGERMTDKGIGNGISMLIMIGIVARLLPSITQEFTNKTTETGGGGLVMFLVEIVVWLVVIAFSILLVQGTRKIPVQYAKRVVGNKQYGGVRQYLPLKVNAAGVMPIIFAQAIMMVPVMFAFGAERGAFLNAIIDTMGFWHNFILAIMIIAFTYFYTAITFNPTQMAEEMKRNNGFIPGVKPGKQTAEYIDTIMSRVVLPGSIFLAIIAILPAIARLFSITTGFSQFFGGTSLLILVGVVLDTLQQIESHLLMRHYDGLLKGGGRIKGRSGSIAAY
ncbi:MAG: preprotein translocase subunit SecY [Prevotellaceae bacterium]|nr:preprotein translocase subunit SecY [Prevotellaceae bacterium]